MPLVWAGSIVIRARKENRVKNDQTVQALITQINEFRSKAAKLLHYDWVPVPLVYTQVSYQHLLLLCFVYFDQLLGAQKLGKQLKTVFIAFESGLSKGGRHPNAG